MFPSLVYIFSYKKDIPKSNWLSSKISYHVKEQVVEDNRTYMVEKFVLGEEWMILGNLLEHYAAAKSLQLCRTLCDPMDCSLPGFSVHGILQARTLEWVAISFSNAWKWKVKVKSFSNPMDCSLPGSSAHGIFQATVLEWGCHCLLH